MCRLATCAIDVTVRLEVERDVLHRAIIIAKRLVSIEFRTRVARLAERVADSLSLLPVARLDALVSLHLLTHMHTHSVRLFHGV